MIWDIYEREPSDGRFYLYTQAMSASEAMRHLAVIVSLGRVGKVLVGRP